MWDERRLRLAVNAAGVGLWSWNGHTGEVSLDFRARTLWNQPEQDQLSLDSLLEAVRRDDVVRVRDTLRRLVVDTDPYEIDFRVESASGLRWLSVRGEKPDADGARSTIYAIVLDVTPRREAERVRELFADEMRHRVKNLFSVASALTAIAARSTTTTVEMERDLRQRLTSLDRAHALAQFGTPNSSAMTLPALIEAGKTFLLIVGGCPSRLSVDPHVATCRGDDAGTAMQIEENRFG